MLDLIAHDLWYLSLIRLIDVENLTVYWEATASFARTPRMKVTGSTPDTTLALLVIRSISGPTFIARAPTDLLDPLADRMLRLLIMRPRSHTAAPPLWTATVWTRTHPAVSAVGKMPNEALRNLIVMINTPLRH